MRILDQLALDGRRVHCIGGADLCAMLGITSGALTGLKKRGLVVHMSHDAYDLEASINAYVTHLRGLAAGWGEGEQAGNLTAERARLAREQADAQAMKNAVARAELVPAEAVERTWGEVLRQVRARLLAVPSRLRQALALDAATAEAIDRELRAALEELGHGDD